jgi:hypothetical protein
MRAVELKWFGRRRRSCRSRALLAAPFGMLFGWFATQRHGVYFSMVTLALAELLFTLAPTWNSLFEGIRRFDHARRLLGFTLDPTSGLLPTLAWAAFSTWCMWASRGHRLVASPCAARRQHRVPFGLQHARGAHVDLQPSRACSRV